MNKNHSPHLPIFFPLYEKLNASQFVELVQIFPYFPFLCCACVFCQNLACGKRVETTRNEEKEHTRERNVEWPMIDANDMCIYGIFTCIFWLLQNVSRILISAAISKTNVTESSCIRSTYVACTEENGNGVSDGQHFLGTEKRVHKFLR